MNPESVQRDPVEEFAEEFVRRQRAGERPSIAEYADRYPRWADEIRELFPGLVLMERLKPATTEVTETPADWHDHQLRQLGDFRILREIGRGGMGIVYEAEQVSLGRHVALKVLPASSLIDPRRLQRFEREARAAARLHHTNIVPVHGVGQQDDVHYIVMQYIPGQGLDQVLDELKRWRDLPGSPAPGAAAPGPTVSARGPASAVAAALVSGVFPAAAQAIPASDDGLDHEPDEAVPAALADAASLSLLRPGDSAASSLTGRSYWHSVARIGVQAADALTYAHGQGLLHRDVKPSNQLLDLQGTVWVTDFGLAKTASETDNLTETGDIVGTLRYLAPERLLGGGDARSDVYALGLTLYELLTFQPAFRETDAHQLMQQVAHDEPAPPRRLNPAVPRDLETIVLKAMAREPARRYPSAAEQAADMRRFLEDRPILARRASVRERLVKWVRRRPAVAALLLCVLAVTLIGVGGVIWQWRDAVAALEREQKALDKAQQAKTLADNEAERAKKEATAAREVADVLMGIFQQSDSLGLSGYLLQARPSREIPFSGRPSKPGEVAAHALLDNGADKVRRELADKPQVQAKLLEGIGAVYLSLGELNKADALLRSALDLRRKLSQGEQAEAARCLAGLGIIRFAHGRFDESTDLLSKALAIQRRHLKHDDPQTLTTAMLLAFERAWRQENPQNLRELEKSFRDLAAVLPAEYRERDLSIALLYLAMAWLRQGDLPKTVLLVAEHDRVCKDKDGPLYQLLRIRAPLAMTYALKNDDKNADRVFHEVVAKVGSVLGESHPVIYFIELEIARMLEQQKRWVLAETFYRDALTTASQVMGRQPRTAMAMEDLARILLERGQAREAIKLLEGALALRIETQDPDQAAVAAVRSKLAQLREARD